MTGWLPVPQPPSPARPWGAHGPVGILASPGPRASSTAGIEFHGEPWQDAKGKAWPPPVSEPLCPGVVDLPRQVQKAPERNQLELEPGIQPPRAPQALSRPGCSCITLLISGCPHLGVEHALGICHEAVGNCATVSGRAEREEGLPLLSTAASPRVKPRRQGRKLQVSAASVVLGVAETGPCPHLSGLWS